MKMIGFVVGARNWRGAQAYSKLRLGGALVRVRLAEFETRDVEIIARITLHSAADGDMNLRAR